MALLINIKEILVSVIVQETRRVEQSLIPWQQGLLSPVDLLMPDTDTSFDYIIGLSMPTGASQPQSHDPAQQGPPPIRGLHHGLQGMAGIDDFRLPAPAAAYFPGLHEDAAGLPTA